MRRTDHIPSPLAAAAHAATPVSPNTRFSLSPPITRSFKQENIVIVEELHRTLAKLCWQDLAWIRVKDNF
jgi:hypothetical protein